MPPRDGVVKLLQNVAGRVVWPVTISTVASTDLSCG